VRRRREAAWAAGLRSARGPVTTTSVARDFADLPGMRTSRGAGAESSLRERRSVPIARAKRSADLLSRFSSCCLSHIGTSTAAHMPAMTR